MYLKRLEVQGFKSFVDKTVLEFDRGITAIVGPNGSGKSNLSDAVRWVLGEQSPKTLRGGKMEDVIFSGTENRRAVGMAEVSLVMDNSCGTLNIDYSDVKITRRLYRSGESEYLLNGSMCRLKDILILFADTGIGRDGFSIISQGKVDEVLNSKSDDRRSIFEDASGIMKYRMRKDESERKLAVTDQNLLRINDILGELERQIEPLTKQAEKAKRYLSFKYELRDIEVGALVDDIKDSEVKVSNLIKNISIVGEQITKTELKLEGIKTENQTKTEESKSLEDKIYGEREKSHELVNLIERINSNIKINENNIHVLKQSCDKNKDEMLNLLSRNLELDNNISLINDKYEETNTKLNETKAQIVQMNEKFNTIMSLLSGDATKAEALKDSLYESKLICTQKASERDFYENDILSVETRNVEINKEIADTLDEIVKITELIKNSEKEYFDSVEETKNLIEEYKVKDISLKELKENSENTSEKLSETVADLKEKQAQLRMMNDLQDSYEGYTRSVKEILTLCKMNNSFGNGIHGAVAEIINVPAEYEYAVETAIGLAYQNIVTESEIEAKKAIDYLKSKNLGRATFLPITSVSGRVLELNTVKQLQTMQGFIGVASDLVKYDSKFERIVNSLLGRVVIFEDLDSCISAAKRFKYSFVGVTTDGDILRTSGAMTGGSKYTGKKTNAFARTREIPQITKYVEQGILKVEELKKNVMEFRGNIGSIENRVNELSNVIRQREVSNERYKNTCNSLNEKKDNLNNRISVLKAESEKNIEDVVGYREQIKVIELVIIELQQEIALKQKEIVLYEEKSVQGATVRATLTDELTKYQIKETEIKNKLDNLIADRERINDEILSIKDKHDYLKLQQDEETNKINKYIKENKDLVSCIDDHNTTKDSNNVLLEQLTARKKEIDLQLSGVVEIISEINSEISILKEEMIRLTSQKAKFDDVKESCQNRLWDEYELTYNKACEICSKTVSVNKEERKKRINELKNTMKNLGNVNVGAIEELDGTKQRYEFLSSQYNDMYLAKDKLLKIILEMSKVMREQFTTQFESIRKNFNDVFCELFGGGKADIVLTDEGNVLESGIDIHVQPPGKKLQNMLLLSGGERALTAIALLFAILRMRPSPFCLLDEIEASLDEANVFRLGKFLIKATEKSQFIMVTHRKGTMETSKTLYGVTMEEKGISKVVSMKLGGE